MYGRPNYEHKFGVQYIDVISRRGITKNGKYLRMHDNKTHGKIALVQRQNMKAKNEQAILTVLTTFIYYVYCIYIYGFCTLP